MYNLAILIIKKGISENTKDDYQTIRNPLIYSESNKDFEHVIILNDIEHGSLPLTWFGNFFEMSYSFKTIFQLKNSLMS